MRSGHVAIGRLTKPHGIKGEIRAEYWAEDTSWLDGPLWLGSGRGALRPVEVESWREQGDFVILRLKGINDRTAAEFLRGCELLVARDDMEEDEDAPLLADLMGCRACLADGTVIGTVSDVLFPAGSEIWEIVTSDGREILFPAVPEFVERFDLDDGKVFLTPPEGLLEVYLGGDEENGTETEKEQRG